MRQVELAPGIFSSTLGFGCASVLGAVDSVRATRAIETALDVGINHFDLARSYGYGDAERFVGRLLASRRDSVRIATKFGIYANWKASVLKPVKPIYRMLRGAKRPNGASTHGVNATPKSVDRFHSRIPVNADSMKKSLEKSLRALGTDFVDFFFVHEPTSRLEHLDQVLRQAESLKSQGKLRCFGLSLANWDSEIHQDYRDRFDILQFAKPLADMQSLLEHRANAANIMFSVFRNSHGQRLPLRQLTQALPRTVFLCSMFTPSHIVANAEEIG